MRKTITLLLAGLLFPVFIIARSGLSMSVSGNMKNVGEMNSQGELIVSNLGAGGSIINEGTLTVPEGITFISDKEKDGLLHNTGSVNLPSDASKVILSKNELTASVFHYISFPFEVDINEIYYLNESRGMTGIWFYEYDSERRANTNSISGNWKLIDDTDPFNAVLKPMRAYCFIYTGNLTSIDFPAHSLNKLYDVEKSFELVYYKNDSKPDTGWGWNSIGPAYTANYTYSSESFAMEVGSVYHYSEEREDYVALDLQLSSFFGDRLVVAPFSHAFFKWVDNTRSLPSGSTRNLSYFQKHGGIDYTDYLRSAGLHDNELVRLQLRGDRSVSDEDKLSVVFGSDYSEILSPLDGEKLFSGSEKSSCLWSEYKGSKLFSVKLPFSDSREIPLGFRAGEKGEYTLALDDLTRTAYESIVLVDRKSGIKTELTTDDYTFASETGVNSDRFVLQINRAVTSLNTPSSDLIIYTKDNFLYISGILIEDQVMVFDITGKLLTNRLANAKEVEISLPERGVYLVKITGSHNQTSKVINQ